MLWLNQFLSQSILQSVVPAIPNHELNPAPVKYLVKFGGDWGGLWGNDEVYKQLVDTVIPFVYVVPEHAAKYPLIIQHLFDVGFPSVVLDAENEWSGQESTLSALLGALNPAQNLIGVSGFAWYYTSEWPDGGKAYANAVSAHDVYWLPQVYMSDYPTNPDQGMERSTEDSVRLFGKLPTVPVFDNSALPLRRDFGVPYSVYSVWEASQVSPTIWEASSNLPPKPLPVVAETVGAEINTALGQALAYATQTDQLIDNIEVMFASQNVNMVPLKNLVSAIVTCLHTARKLNNGE